MRKGDATQQDEGGRQAVPDVEGVASAPGRTVD